MIRKIKDFSIKHPGIVIISFILVTVLFGINLPRNEFDPNMKNQLPVDMPARIKLDKVEEIFGGMDMAMIVVSSDDILTPETLVRIKNISKGLARVRGVDKVLSLFDLKDIKGIDGAMVVEPAVDRIPRNPAQKQKLKERLKNNDIVYKSIVSEDFTATVIIAMLETDVDDTKVSDSIADVVDRYPGKEKISYGGLLFTRVAVGNDMRKDIKVLLPLGLLVMLIFLFVCFRQLRGVILPFVVVVMAIIVSMGLLPVLGWKIQIVTILLPIILIAVANDYGIHLISKYQEFNVEGNTHTNREIARDILDSMGKPIVATGLTTMAGLLCLYSHIIVPAKQLAILSAIGIFYALAASLMFIPAIVSVIPKGRPVIKTGLGKASIIEKLLYLNARWVSGHPRLIIISALFIVVIVSFGIRYVVVDTNPENYYTEKSPIVEVSRIINSKLGGVNVLTVVAGGDIKDPSTLKQIDDLENEFKEMPDIGNTTSLARVIRQMSRAINDKGDKYYDKIPDTREAVAQYLELYSMSGDPEDFEKLVDFPYQHSQVTARITSLSSGKIKSVVNRVEDIIKDKPLFTMVSGFSTIFSQLVEEVVWGQVSSLALSLLVITVFMIILFRSFVAGLMGMIPLALALVLLFGLMGYLGIELNIATALLSSIMIGVGIDYTIHFLWRYREERALGRDYADAAMHTLQTSGRGIIFNALSVIVGFVLLLVSNFLPVKFFGFLVVVSISTCLLAALILLPAVCIVFKPEFLEPKQ
ncbi:MAG: RND family transporter [Oligoflexia bacterium]|nr:RND family transporter [Oligoflexia bacterium]